MFVNIIFSILIYTYAGFATLVLAVLLVLDISGYIRRRNALASHGRGKYVPRVLVIVPCKGMEHELSENLASIARQHYAKYSVVAVVDNKKDTALEAIKNAGIMHLVARGAHGKASGKVIAIAEAVKRFRAYNVYVVADSDIRVDALWLKNLVAPLSDKSVGLSTMFPYFKPVRGFWSKVKMVWGFVGEGLLENESTRFAWGGSMAFKSSLLDKEALKFLVGSRYSVSDDICITKIAKSKGLRIAYVKESRPITLVSTDFSSFVEWANRQTALTILGYRNNLYIGTLYYSAEIFSFVSGIVLTIFVSPVFLFLFLHYIKSVAVTYKRSRTFYIESVFIAVAMPAIYLANLAAAARMKSITWRGSIYPIR